MRKVWVNDPLDPNGLVEQTIQVGDHGRIPSPTCECGFYSYKSEALARARIGRVAGYAAPRSPFGNFGVPEDQLIIGKVKVWGRVIRGTDGYRAQFASIVALIAEDASELDEVLHRYGIIAVPRNKNAATGYVTNLDGDKVRLQTVREDLGWYELCTEALELGQQVTVEFEERGAERCVTSVYVHPVEGQ
jgi:hypothetical protein